MSISVKEREFMTKEDLEEVEFGKAFVKPKQTRHYQCIYWSQKGKGSCVCPSSTIREKEKNFQANWRIKANRKKMKDEGNKPCEGIKEECEYFEYPIPYIPEYDDNFILDLDTAETISFALNDNDNLLIVGPPGCGKSSHVMQMASLLNWETVRFSCTDQMTYSKIIGQWVIVGDTMVWVDGDILDAFRHGKILIEEEVDFMDPSLRGSVHTIMEQGGTLTLTGINPKTGGHMRETVDRHPDFRWISTANTIGLGDDSFLYHGTTLMNAAARDRYSVIMNMDYPSPETEADIVFNKVNESLDNGKTIERDTVESMITVANVVRDAFKGKQCNFPFTIRRMLAWGKYMVQKGSKEGTKLSIINFCNPSDQIFLRGVIETRMGLRIEI